MSTMVLFRMLKNKFCSKERFRDSYIILLHTHIFHTMLSYILYGPLSQRSIHFQLSHVNYWLRPSDWRGRKPKAPPLLGTAIHYLCTRLDTTYRASRQSLNVVQTKSILIASLDMVRTLQNCRKSYHVLLKKVRSLYNSCIKSAPLE